uniref:DNA/RNA non-specific endonuclease n=1 Tax=Vibrio vulnificus TaxID=672 RepID=UPI001EEB696E
MKNLILLSLLFALPAAAEICGQHLDKGMPSTQPDQVLCRDGYAVGYNYNTKNADWVAYHITAESVNASYKRSRERWRRCRTGATRLGARTLAQWVGGSTGCMVAGGG